jgi:hypothetical protein
MRSLAARFKDELADGYVLGPVRVGVGLLLGWQALRGASELSTLGYFGDVFHVPMVPEGLVPSHGLYTLLVALRLCLAMMIVVAVWARPALAVSAVLGGWLLACDRLQLRPDRYSLFVYALLLSLTPCDRSWRAAESRVLASRVGPFWAVRLAQFQVSLVYLASGGSKLLDPDWRSGLVIAARAAHHGPRLMAAGLPRGLVEALARPDASSALAKLVIMSELSICAALWIRPTRAVALWWGLWFHVLFQLLAVELETFTVLTLAMYGVFATPDFHARRLRYDPSRFWGKAAGWLVPLFDWLGRFEINPWEPDDHPGHSVVVERRDGERVTGIRALAMIARCIPVLFPLWAPIALVASFTRQGDLTAAS